jgi:ATP-dependent DNA ligase
MPKLQGHSPGPTVAKSPAPGWVARAEVCTPCGIGAPPKLVAEITYLTWTADNLLRHTVYVGLRADKPAEQVRRDVARA